ncbi:MAG TPA: sodium:solute symporter [Phycisphaerae bacterium]|nr:sodium:solute symporter [Phycisphaerae bacterium]
MSVLDYAVLVGSILAVALYGILRTRGRRNLHDYLRGQRKQSWFVIGLSVMATQASAITFLSTPGQGYAGGLSFVQNYFAMPLALIIISAVFLPLYRKLNVYTAYEFLGARFDTKTRLLTAALFLLQRGMGAGITIYAPAIVLSTVFGWSLPLTIIASSLVVIIYTVAGGSDAVTHTQKYQMAVIFAGMIAAFVILLQKIPCSFPDALAIAGHFGKLNAVSFSADPKERYTFWTGMLGGLFLMLSYFGADQSQVQRYIAGDNLRESRLGLMFNALFKIPMQFGILLLGVLLFVFYLLHPAPIFFNQTAWREMPPTAMSNDPVRYGEDPPREIALGTLERRYKEAQNRRQGEIHAWLQLRKSGTAGEQQFIDTIVQEDASILGAFRAAAREAIHKENPAINTDDNDYIFIDFILDNLPHGLIGLLVAAFFAAALSSKAAELNALASTSVIDFYRAVIRPNASDRHYVLASKAFTIFWGLIAMGFALFAHMSENLIQAANIVGSLFYGVILALFFIAFFIKYIRGTAAFCGALIGEALVLIMFATLPISYLWYNLIGCAACITIAVVLQALLPRDVEPRGFEPVMETNV